MVQELGTVAVDALRDRYQAQASEAQLNLKNYLHNSVGVAEHPNMLDEVDKLVKQLDEALSLLATLDSLGYGKMPHQTTGKIDEPL